MGGSLWNEEGLTEQNEREIFKKGRKKGRMKISSKIVASPLPSLRILLRAVRPSKARLRAEEKSDDTIPSPLEITV